MTVTLTKEEISKYARTFRKCWDAIGSDAAQEGETEFDRETVWELATDVSRAQSFGYLTAVEMRTFYCNVSDEDKHLIKMEAFPYDWYE